MDCPELTPNPMEKQKCTVVLTAPLNVSWHGDRVRGKPRRFQTSKHENQPSFNAYPDICLWYLRFPLQAAMDPGRLPAPSLPKNGGFN